MGFGVELGKSVAKTGANILTGGIVNGIMGGIRDVAGEE